MADRFDEIGTLFLRRRKELGLTQQQLGEKVGVTKSEISKIENGRGITFATINKLSEALEVSAQVEFKPAAMVSPDMIHYIVMSLGMFARKYKLTKKEACNYLSRFKGLDFSIRNYEAEHQLSLQDCVDDMAAICLRNGGALS
ncbi:MAG: helix-turn-helix domain-containing protein [[Clostridium] fimetarium]|nr:helix-turn-helix domain-containing protein [Alistipes timonensis]MCM1405917.1 helix-turn-helix domain-containing protein [[Clostridium] fimetarium]